MTYRNAKARAIPALRLADRNVAILIATGELLRSIQFSAIAVVALGRVRVKHEPVLQFLGRLKHIVALSLALPRNMPGRVKAVNEPPPDAPPAYLQAIRVAGPLPQLPMSPMVEITPMRVFLTLFLKLRLFRVPRLDVPSPEVLDDPFVDPDDEDRDALTFPDLPTELLTVPSVVDRTVSATITVNIDSIVVITDSIPLCPPFWKAFITVTTVSTMLTKLRTVVTPPMTGTKSSIKFNVLNIMVVTL